MWAGRCDSPSSDHILERLPRESPPICFHPEIHKVFRFLENNPVIKMAHPFRKIIRLMRRLEMAAHQERRILILGLHPLYGLVRHYIGRESVDSLTEIAHPGPRVGISVPRLSSKVYTPFIWLYRPVSMEARLGVDNEFVQKQLSRVTPSDTSLFILSACAYSASTLPYIPHVCDVWSSLSMNRMLGLSSGCPASRPFSRAWADAGRKAGNAASEAAQNAY